MNEAFRDKEPLTGRRRGSLIALRTLGEVALCRSNGSEMRSVFVQTKQLALLSYLCCQHCVADARYRRRTGPSGSGLHRRDMLVALLWGEHDTAHAHGALRQALHGLRHEFGERALVARGNTEIGANPAALWCDACAFVEACDRGQLERAASLYGGSFLNGLHVSQAPEYVQWMETSRDRLARYYAKVLERLAGREARAGDLVSAAEWWRQLSEHDPYNSRIVIGAMQALDAAGARCEALRLAERHETLLRQAFDADLEPEVKALADRLRSPTGGVQDSPAGAA